MDETAVWKGSPSHLLNAGSYALSVLVLAIFVAIWIVAGKSLQSAGPIVVGLASAITAMPVLFIAYKWLKLKSIVYEITSERIKVTTGILGKKTNALELYRVKDYVLTEPFFYRLFSRGTIELLTSDPTSQRLVICAIGQARKLLDLIRHNVEACRQAKGVRQVDFDNVESLPKK